ncbi:phage tail protein [Neomegalonema sp.]|uniref:phage tail protein n=1 Tax=Neomegalonema sp. TaxID=2039713 RepID=UPI00263854CF|nr:phage tail protein [Neomegalonema sp.]MDD2870131.1 phage tail protein [Neomegalonema sp.]
MFAMLGPISFRLPAYFEGLSTQRSWNYAQHDVIEGKPKLQYVGEELGEISIDLALHAAYCDPEAEMAKLRVAASMRQAMPLVYGSGHYAGLFVIRRIQSTARHMDGSGVLVALTARLALMEHDGGGGPPPDLREENDVARTSGAGGKTQRASPTPPPSGEASSVPSSRIVRR